MSAYILLFLLILIKAFDYSDDSIYVKHIIPNDTLVKIYFLICFGGLFVISAFRGNFTSDYIGYYNNVSSLSGVPFITAYEQNLHYEPLFFVFIWVIANLFSNTHVFFLVSTLVVLIPIFYFVYKESNCVALSIALFFVMGSYLPSFNVVRQVMAASIFAFAIESINTGNFKKYLLITVLAGLVHKLSFVMIPAFFLLRLEKRKSIPISMLIMVVGLFTYEKIAMMMNTIFNFGYSMSSNVSGVQTTSFISVIEYLAIGIYIFIFSLVAEQDSRENIMTNGAILWSILYVLSMKFQFSVRLSYYFCPFMIVSVPMVTAKLKSRNWVLLTTVVIYVLLFYFLINAYSGSHYNPYYFYWK